jgi:hypothetical protein
MSNSTNAKPTNVVLNGIGRTVVRQQVVSSISRCGAGRLGTFTNGRACPASGATSARYQVHREKNQG